MPNPHLYRESAAILAGCILSITCCTSVLAGNGPAAESVKGGSVDVTGVAADHASRIHVETSLRSETGAFVPPNRALGGPNQVPGDGTGSDHTAFIFAPMRWAGDSGESHYHDHVRSKGQKYSTADIIQSHTNAPICTVVTFHNLIKNNSNNFGTLLITTSGAQGWFGVEPFTKNNAGRIARDAK